MALACDACATVLTYSDAAARTLFLFCFFAFVIGVIAGWTALDSLAGYWFEQQAANASGSQLVSLCILKFACALTAGSLATIPYVFCTVDVAKELRKRANADLLVDFSTFVIVGVNKQATRFELALGDQFRPPRHNS